MENSAHFAKSFANRVAKLAMSETGAGLMRLLRAGGFLEAPPTTNDASGHTDGREPPVNANRVGIWNRKTTQDGKAAFARTTDTLQEWDLWADVARIEPKQAKRVVLIGESTARGFLYDPQFNPAMVLRSILESCLAKSACDVVDLARTNLGAEVKELALSALSLSPDALVVLAGNNWRFSFANRQNTPSVDTALREQGIPGLKRLIEEDLASRVRDMVRDISSAYHAANIPVIWIIPEFNLAEWREPVTNAPHLSHATANLEWITLWEAVQAALKRGDYREAEKAASRMTELDEQTSVAGLYALAECSRHRGDTHAERHYLEAARDALIWDISRPVSPRPYSVTQNALRQEAARWHDRIVDLPRCFEDHLQGGIPGRRMFLDYCHLTVEGIQVTMAAVAAKIMEVLRASKASAQELLRYCPDPGPRIRSEGHFLAAVHNAHWHQSREIVEHCCVQALRAFPAIARVMTQFLQGQARRTPLLMCKAAEQIADADSPLVQRYLLHYSQQQLDRLLSDVIISSLQKLGVDAGPEIEQLILKEHLSAHKNVDLLDYYYCSSARQPQEIMWVMPRSDLRLRLSHYYKAYWGVSRFFFVAEEAHPTSLHLTCRVPGPSTQEVEISIAVNGNLQSRAGVTSQWSTFVIALGENQLRNGVNEIEIHWPTPRFAGQEALKLAADDLLQEVPPDFHPLFGEIHSLCAYQHREPSLSSSHLQLTSAQVG